MKHCILAIPFIIVTTNAYSQTPNPCIFQLRTQSHFAAITGDTPVSISGYGTDGVTDVTSIGLTGSDGTIYTATTVTDEQGASQHLDIIAYAGASPSSDLLYSQSVCEYEIVSPDNLASNVDISVEIDVSSVGINHLTWSVGEVYINDILEYAYEYDSGSGIRIFDNYTEYYGIYEYSPATGSSTRLNSEIFGVENVSVGSKIKIIKTTWSDGGGTQELTFNDILVRITDSY